VVCPTFDPDIAKSRPAADPMARDRHRAACWPAKVEAGFTGAHRVGGRASKGGSWRCWRFDNPERAWLHRRVADSKISTWRVGCKPSASSFPVDDAMRVLANGERVAHLWAVGRSYGR